MQTRDLDHWFDNYRRNGDVEALARVFDATSKELFAVASHLARDASEAEDLVQETYLTAIERAWSYDLAWPLVPWLVGITTVAARRKRKLAARAIDATRLDERVVEAPDRALAARELDDAIRAALADVPEKYRRVLEMHLDENKKPAEIASELASSPGNIRVQLHRGLELLRKALPAGIALGASVPLAGGDALDAIRRAVLENARDSAGRLTLEGERFARAALRRTRWTLAAKSAAIGASLLIASAVAWHALTNSSALVATQSAGFQGASVERGDAMLAQLVAPANIDRSRAAAPLAETGASPTAILVIHATGLEAGVRGKVRIAVESLEKRDAPLFFECEAKPTLEIDVSPLFDAEPSSDPKARNGIHLKAPSQLYTSLDHPDYLPTQIVWVGGVDRDNGSRPLRVECQAHFAKAIGAVEGRVVGVPIAADPNHLASELFSASSGDATILQHGVEEKIGALPVVVGLVRVKPGGSLGIQPSESAFVAIDGTFRLRAADEGEHLVSIDSYAGRAEFRRVTIKAGTTAKLGDVRVEAGETLRGRVVGAAAHVTCSPIGSARITPNGWGLTWCDGAFCREQSVETKADGSFVFEHLAAKPYRLKLWSSATPRGAKNDFSAHHLDVYDLANFVDATPPATVELEFRELSIEVEVTDHGAPASEVEVELVQAGRARSGLRTDEQGRIVLDVHGHEAFALRVDRGNDASRDVAVDPREWPEGRRVQLELDSAAPRTKLTFEVDDPQLLAVSVTPLDGLEEAARARIARGIYLDREPTILLRDLGARGELAQAIPVGHLAIDLRPREAFSETREEYRLPFIVEVDAEARHELHLAPHFELGGRLSLRAGDFVASDERVTCELVDANGVALHPRFARRVLDVNGRAITDSGSMLELAAPSITNVLRAGLYRLKVGGAHVQDFETSVEVVAGRTTDVELALRSR